MTTMISSCTWERERERERSLQGYEESTHAFEQMQHHTNYNTKYIHIQSFEGEWTWQLSLSLSLNNEPCQRGMLLLCLTDWSLETWSINIAFGKDRSG